MNRTLNRGPWRALLASGVVLICCAGAWAEVTAISADINASLTELIDNETGSTDASFEQFPETSPALPIETFAGLGNFTGETGEDYGARAIAELQDPTTSQLSNPAELGIEIDLFSDAGRISYAGVAEVVEQRTVALSAEDLGATPDGDEKLVTSSTFLSGAMVIWSRTEDRDLTGLSSAFDFVVKQASATTEPEVVFEATVRIDGQTDGEVRVVRSDVLEVLLGGPELLAGQGDAESLALVAALEAIGRVHVLIVPEQEVQYAYLAQADSPFVLQAEVACRSTNLPDGTGVAAVFGRPFRSLAATIASALPSPKAEQAQAAVNRLMAEGITTDGDGLTPGPLCGAFGWEIGLVSTLGLLSQRRRSHQRPAR